MKMKQKLIWGLTIMLIPMCWACSDDKSDEPEPEVGKISTSSQTIELQQQGGTETFTVNATGKAWTMNISGLMDGIQVTPQQGNAGTATVTLTATANTSEDSRYGVLTLCLDDKSDSVVVNVSQPGVAVKYSRKTDSLALVAVYKALDGAKWELNGGKALNRAQQNATGIKYPWDLTLPMDQWSGITLNNIEGEMRVTGFDLLALGGVKGKLPEDITKLRELRSLNILDATSISGPVPEAIYRLSKCERLSIRKMDQMEWTVPERIIEMTSLKALTLERLTMTEQDFKRIYGLKGLDSLALNTGSIKGVLPAGISAMTNLVYLDLNNCSRLNNIDEICSLPQLKSLLLAGCADLSALPAEIGKLTNLENILLTGCKKLSVLPESFAQLTSIKTLYITGTKISGDLDKLFAGMTKLEEIQADNNYFTGSLDWLKNMKSLRVLNLSENHLSGKIDFADLNPGIELLMLGGNEITGTLNGIEKLTKLNTFSMSKCKMSGTLPAGLAALPLISVFLDGNDFTGNIPAEYASLKLMLPLTLKNNCLSGTLPDAIVKAWLVDKNLSYSFCEQKSGYGFTNCGVNN